MSASVHDALSTLLSELLDGASVDSGWVLNPKDPGILKPLRSLSANDASNVPEGGTSSVAAHVGHLRYGLNLMNRWSKGESPFSDADWSQNWRHITVSDSEWTELRSAFERESREWLQAIKTPRVFTDEELKGYIASVVHLAYHIGAIRQMNAALRGPKDNAKP